MKYPEEEFTEFEAKNTTTPICVVDQLEGGEYYFSTFKQAMLFAANKKEFEVFYIMQGGSHVGSWYHKLRLSAANEALVEHREEFNDFLDAWIEEREQLRKSLFNIQ